MRPIYEMTSVRVGAVLYHSAFGFAVVDSIYDSKATVRWQKPTTWLPKSVQIEQLTGVYRICTPNGFFHRAVLEPAALRTLLHVDPQHAVSMLLRDLERPQTKQDIHDWIVGQDLLTHSIFDEWWQDVLDNCDHSPELQWTGEQLRIRKNHDLESKEDHLFSDSLLPGTRLGLAVENREQLTQSVFLEQVCRAWTEGGTQVRALALSECLQFDPNQVFACLLGFSNPNVDALIHCLRGSNWVPAQLNPTTLDQLNHRATGALTPESPLEAESRLTTALLRWGHPTVLDSLCACIQSPDGQRLLYSLSSTMVPQRAQALLRKLFIRCMQAERVQEAEWCVREWSLRSLKSREELAEIESDERVVHWLTAPTSALRSGNKNPIIKHAPTVLSTRIEGRDVYAFTIGLARALRRHEVAGTVPDFDSAQDGTSTLKEAELPSLKNPEDVPQSATPLLTQAARKVLDRLVERELKDELCPQQVLPYLRILRPDLPPRFVGCLGAALSKSDAIRPPDAKAWIATLESARTYDNTPINEKATPEVVFDSHIGHQKLLHSQVNQDSLFAEVRGNQALIVVCDGVSRSEIGRGDQASRIATRTISEIWSHASNQLRDATWEEYKGLLPRAIATANIAVTNAAVRTASRGQGRGSTPMATTIVAAISLGNRIFVAWMGDSRAYVANPTGASLLTADHQTAAQQIDRWRTDHDQRLGPLSTSLSHFMGANMELTRPMNFDVQTIELTLAEDEHLILCSDGVSAYIADTPSAVERIFADQCAQAPFSEVARQLVNLANQAGGWDNSTCIALRTT